MTTINSESGNYNQGNINRPIDRNNQLDNTIQGDGFSLILTRLSNWFQAHSRELPWRDRPEPYRVWISEIMLQQTQVATVIDYFNRFITRFPDLESLAHASEDEVTAQWSGLGYYSRARNLLSAAQLMFKGEGVPSNRKELEMLPGIGPYTAGAILSIAYGQYEAILDGNLDRVFSRLLEISRDSQYKKRLWRISRLFIAKAEVMGLDPSVINQALMEIGALICRKQSPLCDQCPLQLKCKALQNQRQSEFPQKSPRKNFIQIEEDRFFISDSNGLFLVVRDANARWRKGTWDLPDLSILSPDSPLFPSLPSTVEAFSNGPTQGVAFLSDQAHIVKLVVTNHKITRRIYCATLSQSNLVIENKLEGDSSQYRWVMDYTEIPFNSALKKSIDKIRK